MILYALHYRNFESGYDDWVMVSIHKSYEVAEKFMDQYKNNHISNGSFGAEYIIHRINTDIDSDTIYDYMELNDLEYDD